jgi:hypothetical protein
LRGDLPRREKGPDGPFYIAGVPGSYFFFFEPFDGVAFLLAAFFSWWLTLAPPITRRRRRRCEPILSLAGRGLKRVFFEPISVACAASLD